MKTGGQHEVVVQYPFHDGLRFWSSALEHVISRPEQLIFRPELLRKIPVQVDVVRVESAGLGTALPTVSFLPKKCELNQDDPKCFKKSYLSLDETVRIHGWQEKDICGVEQPVNSLVSLIFLNQIRDGLKNQLAANDFVSVNVTNLMFLSRPPHKDLKYTL